MPDGPERLIAAPSKPATKRMALAPVTSASVSRKAAPRSAPKGAGYAESRYPGDLINSMFQSAKQQVAPISRPAPMPDSFDAMLESAIKQVGPQSRPAPKPAPPESEWPFYCLGYDRDRFFLYTKEGRQVIAMSAKDLSSHGMLLKLANINWFEENFPTRGEGFGARQVANEVIRACYQNGVYDPDRIRGRGVWIDRGRSVLHMGDHLLVDGVPTSLTAIESRFIYEQARSMRVDLGEPLTDEEGKRFLALCRAVAWDDPTRDGSFFAGFIASAIISGALPWRPHIWLLSEFGGGKTWVQDNILTPALGGIALVLQGKTTEAGVRGELGNDARPVFFEEGETQNEMDRARMQQVIDLARQASSENAPPIVKGTKEGGSRRYVIRSSFMFASINAGLTQAADESRFAVLTLCGGNPDQFAALKLAHQEAMVPNLAGRLLARLLVMIPTIRANCDAMAEAIARTGAGRRVGDTIGTLIACQMALVDQRKLTPEEAAKIVAGRAWVREAAAEAVTAPEYERALAHLMQGEGMRRTVGSRQESVSIAQLISATDGFDEDIKPNEADIHLRRMWMRVVDHREHGRCLMISTRSDAVAQRFRNTPWGAGWLSTLARIPGAHRNVTARLEDGTQKCLAIPIASIAQESTDAA
ncbi:hypothetical protein [Falsiroseomonas sp. E2-1-a20]|uniref:hypothetical protein n=1 Tax=Falsiroseomonas sp. E2-1-a20 TaxID=3239300 RepID=UPI003F3784EC